MYLSLNETTISNDGYVLASDIAEFNGVLLCHTDRSDCCRTSDGATQGHWYYPNGSQVRSFTQAENLTGSEPRNFFYRNRDTGIVRLNRQGDPPERGRFRCEIPEGSATTYIFVRDFEIT